MKPIETNHDANQHRLELARTNAIAYSRLPQIRAIGITGSVARQQADRYSDIDMSLYYGELPSEQELKAAYEQNQGTNYRLYADERETGAIVEQYFVQGIRCDFGHVTIQRFECDIAMLLEQCDPDNLLLKILEGIVDMLPLHGAALIEQWKLKVSHYPEQLTQAMVRKYLNFRPLWILSNYGIERDDVLFRYDEQMKAIKQIIGVLLGLNRFYHPIEAAPLKGMEQLISRMTIAPRDLSLRLRQLFKAEPDAAIQQLGELIEEVFDLVQQHRPEIDVIEAWQRYQYGQTNTKH